MKDLFNEIKSSIVSNFLIGLIALVYILIVLLYIGIFCVSFFLIFEAWQYAWYFPIIGIIMFAECIGMLIRVISKL